MEAADAPSGDWGGGKAVWSKLQQQQQQQGSLGEGAAGGGLGEGVVKSHLGESAQMGSSTDSVDEDLMALITELEDLAV
jgi:hypothetical protein